MLWGKSIEVAEYEVMELTCHMNWSKYICTWNSCQLKLSGTWQDCYPIKAGRKIHMKLSRKKRKTTRWGPVPPEWRLRGKGRIHGWRSWGVSIKSHRLDASVLGFYTGGMASWRSSGTSRGLWKPLILFMRSTCVSVCPRGREKKAKIGLLFAVVQSLSCVWLSETLWTAAHSLQPSPSPGACSNPCPLSRWCHPTISSSVVPLLLLLSIFPSIRVFSKELYLYKGY